MKKIVKFAMAVCSVALLGNADLLTNSIAVANHSFESDPVMEPKVGLPDGWSILATDAPNGAKGLIPTNDNQHSVSGAIDGNQYAFLCGRKNTGSTDTSPNYLYQQVIGGTGAAVVLKEGDQLILTVALAISRFDLQNFSVGLYSDSGLTDALMVLDQTDIALTTTFTDYELTWTVTAAYAGTPVYVGFSADDIAMTASTPRLGIDNVRLGHVIPEPATIGIISFGALVAYAVRRLRRD